MSKSSGVSKKTVTTSKASSQTRFEKIKSKIPILVKGKQSANNAVDQLRVRLDKVTVACSASVNPVEATKSLANIDVALLKENSDFVLPKTVGDTVAQGKTMSEIPNMCSVSNSLYNIHMTAFYFADVHLLLPNLQD